MARLCDSRKTVHGLTLAAICAIAFYLYSFTGRVEKLGSASLGISRPAQTNTLLPLVFETLPLGSIRPRGWLRDELEASAAGLAGHEYDFYEHVTRSPWLGGDREYAKLNEGLPYWFNGLVFLAYGLDDERLKSQVHAVAEYVLAHQQADGWIGPEEPGLRTFWARYPFFLGLTGLAEANSTWTDQIVSRLHVFTRLMYHMLKNHGDGYVWRQGGQLTQRDFSWGQARSADMVLTLTWLYENYPEGQESILFETMQMFYDLGLKWESWYNKAAYMVEDDEAGDRGDLRPSFEWKHGVNVAQGLKSPAVFRRVTKNESLSQTARDAVDWTFLLHGSASGTIIADDEISGQAPYSGSELCTTVEAMFSLSYLYQALGIKNFADRCERAAFNGLPASVTVDWWAHQYMHQANQPWSKKLDQSPFGHTNELSQTFGLEPNLPCCTLNHPQGLPKFLAASFLRHGSNGLAHALLSPARVEVVLSSGTRVVVDCDTAYPFSDTLSYSVYASAAFDFLVRIPAWSSASHTQASLNGEIVSSTADSTTGMLQLSVPPGTSRVEIVLGPSIITEPRPDDMVAVTRGALVYALNIDAETKFTRPKAYKNQSMFAAGYAPEKARDYTMVNSSAWNLAIDPATLRFHGSHKIRHPVFAPSDYSQHISVLACEIDWPLYRGSIPDVPIPAAQRKCLGDVLNVTLRPVGAAKLHMMDLPVIKLV